MPCLLVLLWSVSLAALWVCAVRAARVPAGASASDHRAGVWPILFLAVGPPTLVFSVSWFVLLQAAPTVQFNAGNPSALGLWSFWVHWWPSIFGCSGLQTVGYFFGAVAVFLSRRGARLGVPVACAFLTSLWGSLVLSMAYPSA